MSLLNRRLISEKPDRKAEVIFALSVLAARLEARLLNEVDIDNIENV